MDKAKAKKVRKAPGTGLPFGSKNYIIMGIGLLVIALGYIALAQGPADNPLSRTLAPILLTLGYCVLMPLGILLNK
jgi:hypothetical protein